MKEVMFLVVVLIANIIHGITGFAGTVLAMPPSVMLVGLDVAKPILNALGLLSGIYVVAKSYRYVNIKEFLKTTSVMLAGLCGGMFLKGLIAGHPRPMNIIFGTIVTAVGLSGAYRFFFRHGKGRHYGAVVDWFLLIAAGVVHGMFVCGGPLLVSYFSDRIEDKNEFRSTISAVWIVLNGILLFDDIRLGYWTPHTLQLAIPAAVVLSAGMFIGGILYKKMSRNVFMKTSYILLIVSGMTMLAK